MVATQGVSGTPYEISTQRTAVIQWWWGERDDLHMAKKVTKMLLQGRYTCPPTKDRKLWKTMITYILKGLGEENGFSLSKVEYSDWEGKKGWDLELWGF